MQIWCNVMAHECEETGDGEGLVTIPEGIEIDGLVVEEAAQKRDDSIYWDHDENTNDAGSVSLQG